ncbi:hypothetical protein BDV96DRAFT_588838 [Lophiotrema nucula]|uniref:Rhodopsin domain-containing protein n=1 Tax=Lophiotrema nucula TaxID=690887 RepID=A0A6A5YL97_9PLEO|nr:hypothetical protein BDV96DRAFT_588838 [Lophiotrema nucula]
MIFLVMPCLYFTAVALPKLAIIDLYLQVFRCRKTIYVCYGIAAVIVLTAIVNTFVTIFQCTPINDLWAPVDKGHGHCMNVNVLFQWASFPNILADVAMLVLPMPTVWRLQTGWRVRLGVCVTFLTGSIGLAASIARFAAFTHSTAGDPLWDAVPAAIWAIAEPGILLIAACLVTLKPLFQYVMHQSSISSFFAKTKQTSPSWPKSNASSRTLESMESGGSKGSVVRLEQLSAQKAQLYAQAAYSGNFV